MAQPLSYEAKDTVFLITSRTIGSRLWFLNNRALEEAILGYLAKYQEVYGVILHGFVMMGNHYHLLAKFPEANRAKFMRAFNSIFAKLVTRHVSRFDQGKLWARRYSFQSVPRGEDVLHWFMYLALNPVSSGLCKKPEQYRSYNSFYEASREVTRTFKVFDRTHYSDKKRFNPNIRREDFEKEYTLRYSRLPGLEDMGASDYTRHLAEIREARRQELVTERIANGSGFASKDILLNTTPGVKPYHTKKSNRYSFRPLVLTLCKETRRKFLNEYFELLNAFRQASLAFRSGFTSVVFPQGTYPPSLFAVS